MRVLVAEDDRSVAAALASALTRVGYACTRCDRGAEALRMSSGADLLLLDLGLSDMDGLEVLAQLRPKSDIPVIVVTARGDERSTVQALQLGADDYIVKPVRLHELLARLKAVSRRYAVTHSATLEIGGLLLDPSASRATFDGNEIKLTPTEVALLVTLADRIGATITRQDLIQRVWGGEYPQNSRSVDVHLTQLRQKLPMLRITTVRGIGLRLEVPQ